ncbi:MAG TPA: hypothetical protein VNL91_04380 [Thermoanaerobaculia bacterium]|nr:hypothetical protein [Thermoanaerobaculia bacterium]
MKKVLAVIVVLALVVWVLSWFRNEEAVAASGSQPWPGGLGTLESVPERPAPQENNDAAVRLTALGGALPANKALDEYVGREIERGELTIGAPPPLTDVSAIRELLLREPVVWKRFDGIGGDDDTQTRRSMLMRVARALVAAALAKGRADDAAAWDELHAVWRLARSLDGHPQMLVQTAALSMARMVNAVAWKMPLPPPAWLGELQARDSVRPLLEAFHHQTASYWRDGARLFPTKWLGDSVEHDRRIAEELFRTTACDVNVRSNEVGVDLSLVWRRAFRYRAEREATANALRVREGKPVEAKSVCSDGSWTLDGTTLRFSRAIPTAPPDRPMPLLLRIEPQAPRFPSRAAPPHLDENHDTGELRPARRNRNEKLPRKEWKPAAAAEQ